MNRRAFIVGLVVAGAHRKAAHSRRIVIRARSNGRYATLTQEELADALKATKANLEREIRIASGFFAKDWNS